MYRVPDMLRGLYILKPSKLSTLNGKVVGLNAMTVVVKGDAWGRGREKIKPRAY